MSAARALQAVVFDLDGVLIDSEPLWYQAEQRVFAEVGVTLTLADCLTTTGLRMDEVARHWFARRPWTGPTPGQVAAQVVDAMVEAVTRQGRALPGAHHAVDTAASLGVPLAVASSSPTRLIEAALARLGLQDRFAAVASAEDEALGKPHPAVYLSAARLLGVDPARCVALEDSPNGVRAAKAAGMRCVAVPEPAHAAAVAALADAVLASLTELTTAHLVG